MLLVRFYSPRPTVFLTTVDDVHNLPCCLAYRCSPRARAAFSGPGLRERHTIYRQKSSGNTPSQIYDGAKINTTAPNMSAILDRVTLVVSSSL